jgi:DNA-damage-inducible protein J
MAKTTTIRARVEPELKNDVDEILSALGLTASETIHLLYRQIRLRKGLPFDVRLPNELTARTLKSTRTGKDVKHFTDKKALYADLGL